MNQKLQHHKIRIYEMYKKIINIKQYYFQNKILRFQKFYEFQNHHILIFVVFN